jgi:hypothetical protein
MLFYLLGTLYKGKLRYFFLQMNIKKNRKDELDTGDRTKTNKIENIAAILYSDQVQRLIDFPEYGTHEEIVNALNRVEKSAGGSRIDEAIRYIRTKSFRRSVARSHATQVAIIITASPTSALHKRTYHRNISRHGIAENMRTWC